MYCSLFVCVCSVKDILTYTTAILCKKTNKTDDMTSLLKKRLLLVWLDKDTESQDNSFGMLILTTLKKNLPQGFGSYQASLCGKSLLNTFWDFNQGILLEFFSSDGNGSHIFWSNLGIIDYISLQNSNFSLKKGFKYTKW